MAKTVTIDHKVETAANAVGFLNQAEWLMTGWVLGFDREKIAELMGPLYELLDTGLVDDEAIENAKHLVAQGDEAGFDEATITEARKLLRYVGA